MCVAVEVLIDPDCQIQGALSTENFPSKSLIVGNYAKKHQGTESFVNVLTIKLCHMNCPKSMCRLLTTHS